MSDMIHIMYKGKAVDAVKKPAAFISVAIWPENSGVRNMYGYPVSTDAHTTHSAAIAVCDRLIEEGLGGERKYFPIEVFVERG